MHVAFHAERAFCEELSAALADPRLQAETLERWWQRREARLDAVLSPRPRDLAHAAPPEVRLAALHAVERLAPRIPALEAIGAPTMVVDFQRRLLAQALAELDPAQPRAHTPVPEIAERWVFVDRMLAAAHAGMPSLSLDDVWPALIELPRSFEPARAEASGPISYAFAGDAPGPHLDRRLADRLHLLAGDEALISFIWFENDSAGDWDPLRV